MTLTNDQKQALEKMIDWWKNHKNKKNFVLAGYAGTGKSFLITEFVKNHLKINPEKVAYCTPTGKAATVLIKNGVENAMTIHRFIYSPKEEYIDKVGKDGVVRKEIVIVFEKNLELLFDAKLIIIDEISMVSEEIYNDLASFKVPIICSGDPGQLEPVNGDKLKFLENPDAVLTEIVRQNKDNKIIEIAEKIRNGDIFIPYGTYGENGEVQIIRKGSLGRKALMGLINKVEQVLCGRNSTRDALNAMIRESKGFVGKKPNKGEKLICVQNNWNLPIDKDYKYNLVNGMIGTIENQLDQESQFAYERIDFKPDFLDEPARYIPIDMGKFIHNKTLYKRGDSTDGLLPELINQFEFAYAISVHKAQGSQFESVLIVDESRAFGESKYKWLYTAITRAEKKVIIVR